MTSVYDSISSKQSHQVNLVLNTYFEEQNVSMHVIFREKFKTIMFSPYSGTSLLRSTTGLGKSDLNVEVTLFQGVICSVEYNLGLSQGDCNGEVVLLVR